MTESIGSAGSDRADSVYHSSSMSPAGTLWYSLYSVLCLRGPGGRTAESIRCALRTRKASGTSEEEAVLRRSQDVASGTRQYYAINTLYADLGTQRPGQWSAGNRPPPYVRSRPISPPPDRPARDEVHPARDRWQPEHLPGAEPSMRAGLHDQGRARRIRRWRRHDPLRPRRHRRAAERRLSALRTLRGAAPPGHCKRGRRLAGRGAATRAHLRAV